MEDAGCWKGLVPFKVKNEDILGHHNEEKVKSIYVHVAITDVGCLLFGLEFRLATGWLQNNSSHNSDMRLQKPRSSIISCFKWLLNGVSNAYSIFFFSIIWSKHILVRYLKVVKLNFYCGHTIKHTIKMSLYEGIFKPSSNTHSITHHPSCMFWRPGPKLEMHKV